MSKTFDEMLHLFANHCCRKLELQAKKGLCNAQAFTTTGVPIDRCQSVSSNKIFARLSKYTLIGSVAEAAAPIASISQFDGKHFRAMIA